MIPPDDVEGESDEGYDYSEDEEGKGDTPNDKTPGLAPTDVLTRSSLFNQQQMPSTAILWPLLQTTVSARDGCHRHDSLANERSPATVNNTIVAAPTSSLPDGDFDDLRDFTTVH